MSDAHTQETKRLLRNVEAKSLRMTQGSCSFDDYREARAALLANIERGFQSQLRMAALYEQVSRVIASADLGINETRLHDYLSGEHGISAESVVCELPDEPTLSVSERLAHIERGRVPEGWKLVPNFVTEEMQEAFYGNTEVTRVGSILNFSAGYSAMLAAAPAAPDHSATAPAEVPMPEAVERAMVKVIDTSADVVCHEANDDHFKRLLKRSKDSQAELLAAVRLYGDAREAAGYARGLAEKGGA